MSAPKLIVFDCDGTLVDSQHVILEAMRRAFVAHDLPPPPLSAVRRVVGLELVQAVGLLMPETAGDKHLPVAEAYKNAFGDLRQDPAHHEPLYEGIAALLDRLSALNYILGVATGKSRRGLRNTIALHGLEGRFATLQTNDTNPGKPHPGMLETAMAETGFAPSETVMIGDTTFDMEMAVNAGVRPIGVSWGYHAPEELRATGAEVVAEDAAHLSDVLGLDA